jgi:hypothetical protein
MVEVELKREEYVKEQKLKLAQHMDQFLKDYTKDMNDKVARDLVSVYARNEWIIFH